MEYRSKVDRYFVVFPTLNVEIVMAFENKYTAREIAVNAYVGTPFFTMIPTVDYGTPYPRPDFLYPRLVYPDIPMVIINS